MHFFWRTGLAAEVNQPRSAVSSNPHNLRKHKAISENPRAESANPRAESQSGSTGGNRRPALQGPGAAPGRAGHAARQDDLRGDGNAALRRGPRLVRDPPHQGVVALAVIAAALTDVHCRAGGWQRSAASVLGRLQGGGALVGAARLQPGRPACGGRRGPLPAPGPRRHSMRANIT